MLGDREALAALFDGLLENAVHLSGTEGKAVVLSLRRLSGPPPRLAVRVRATGMGLPQEAKKRLFDPFFSEGGHHGMWYAMAYLVTRSHQGTLRVRSGPREGTSVLTLLPEAEPEAEMTDAEIAKAVASRLQPPAR